MRFSNAEHPHVMTAVYRLFDAGHRLLYVGIAYDFDARFAKHKLEKPWWPDVVFKDVIWYDNRLDAEYDEAQAIREEAPLYNRRPGIDLLGLAVIKTRAGQRGPLVDVVNPRLMVSKFEIDQYFVHRPWHRDHVVVTKHGQPAAVLVDIAWYTRARQSLGDPTDIRVAPKKPSE